MKYFPILFLFALCVYSSCNQVNTNLKDESPFINDLDKYAEIDSLAKKIDKTLIHDKIEQINVSLVSEKDELVYIPAEGNLARIDLKIYPENTDQWVTFYLKNENVILFRYREWIKEGKPSARESHTYFEKDKIIFAEERFKDLAPGQPPINLRLENFEKTNKGRKEVFMEFNKYWEPTLKAWQEHNKNK